MTVNLSKVTIEVIANEQAVQRVRNAIDADMVDEMSKSLLDSESRRKRFANKTIFELTAQCRQRQTESHKDKQKARDKKETTTVKIKKN